MIEKQGLRMSIAALLKKSRKEQGLSQREVAERYNEKYGTSWGRMSISDIEKGRASFETFDRIAELLGIKFEIIIK